MGIVTNISQVNTHTHEHIIHACIHTHTHTHTHTHAHTHTHTHTHTESMHCIHTECVFDCMFNTSYAPIHLYNQLQVAGMVVPVFHLNSIALISLPHSSWSICLVRLQLNIFFGSCRLIPHKEDELVQKVVLSACPLAVEYTAFF